MASIRVTMWGSREDAIAGLAVAYPNWTVIDESPILNKTKTEVIGWRFVLSNSIV